MSFKHKQSAVTLNTLGVLSLLVSETYANVETGSLDKSYQGNPMSEAMIQNLAMTTVERELAEKRLC